MMEKENDGLLRYQANSPEKELKRIRFALAGRKILIYGAGASGKQIAEALRGEGIEAAGFIDKKAGEIREAAGLSVYPPDEMSRFVGDDLLIVIAVDPQIFKNSTSEIKNNIARYLGEDQEVISYGRDLLYTLRHHTCLKKSGEQASFDVTDCIDCGAESRGCDIFMDYLKSINMKEPRESLKHEFTQYFGYILGQRCTLKCRDCCELVPYYRDGRFVPKETVLADCRTLAAASRFTMYVELIGGEPFLHPDIAEILRELLKLENVGFVKVFTNGTVVPDSRLLDVLKEPRVVLMWSNYTHSVTGKLYENIVKTRKVLDEAGIRYIYSHAETWLDFATSFDPVEKDEEKLKRDFDDCHIAKCLRLYRGTLYRCPHHYAGIQTGKLEKIEGEYVELSRYATAEELSEAFYDFSHLPYIEACRRCLLPYDAKEVPAAVQLG